MQAFSACFMKFCLALNSYQLLINTRIDLSSQVTCFTYFHRSLSKGGCRASCARLVIL